MHTITGHKVAMKFISKAVIQRERTKTRVKREFEYMRTLRHPHIIKLWVALCFFNCFFGIPGTIQLTI